MIQNEFSKWAQWQERGNLPKIRFPGVYAVAHSERNLTNMPFSWLQEIIYIGMTTRANGLQSRLSEFEGTLKRKIKHGGADRVLYKHPNYDELVPNLYVSILPVECDASSLKPDDLRKKGDIVRLEYYCFAEYVSRFGVYCEFNNEKLSPKFSKSLRRKNTLKNEF